MEAVICVHNPINRTKRSLRCPIMDNESYRRHQPLRGAGFQRNYYVGVVFSRLDNDMLVGSDLATVSEWQLAQSQCPVGIC